MGVLEVPEPVDGAAARQGDVELVPVIAEPCDDSFVPEAVAPDGEHWWSASDVVQQVILAEHPGLWHQHIPSTSVLGP